MKKRGVLPLLIFLCPIALFSSQDRGFAVVAKTNDGKVIDLYKACHALIIGISDYISGWPDLPNAVNDANSVADQLSALGFKVTKLLNPDKDQLTQAVENFVFGPGQDPGNCLVIFFAGHGHTERLSYGEDMGYIVPRDAPLPAQNKPEFMKKSVDMKTIEGYAHRIQAKHTLFLFDSCFSGAIFDIVRAVPAAISYKTALPVRQFITAGAADESVPDRSIFKGQLIEGLQGEADRNSDGFVTGTELGEFLQEKVVNYTRGGQHPQYGKIRDPNLDKGDFVFVLEKASAGGPTDSQAPPRPPEKTGLDLDKLKKAAEERANAEADWANWQAKMRSDFSEMEKLDRDPNLTIDEKKNGWQSYLNMYSRDNPYSNEDDDLRQRAEQRLKALAEPKPTIQARVMLRSSPESLSEGEVEAMLKRNNFFSKLHGRNKKFGNPSGDFDNDYEPRTINGDKVVIDHATGLMWHLSGSYKYMNYGKVKGWIEELNSTVYAGYRDWRLPTLEEAASLIENEKLNGNLYIDPVFSAEQWWIWTSDLVTSDSGRAWVADFENGQVFSYAFSYNVDVRPVRSAK